MTNSRSIALRIVVAMALIAVAAYSFLVIAKQVTTVSFHQRTINSLEEKKGTVMQLTGIAAASSTAISFMPDDIATPIADEIAELSTYFLIILSAIVLEKTLVVAIGYVSFSVLIPLACGLGIASLFAKRRFWRVLAIKMAILGLVIFVAIPMSIQVCDLIDASYQYSLEQTIALTEQNNEYIAETKKDLAQEDKNWMGKIGEYISNLTSSIGTGIEEMMKKGEDTLSAMLDAIAILIITCCVMPILVMFVFFWVIKNFIGFVGRALDEGEGKMA